MKIVKWSISCCKKNYTNTNYRLLCVCTDSLLNHTCNPLTWAAHWSAQECAEGVQPHFRSPFSLSSALVPLHHAPGQYPLASLWNSTCVCWGGWVSIRMQLHQTRIMLSHLSSRHCIVTRRGSEQLSRAFCTLLLLVIRFSVSRTTSSSFFSSSSFQNLMSWILCSS